MAPEYSATAMQSLLDAIHSGDDDKARSLVREQPQLVGTRAGDGLLPAVHAYYYGREELARELLPADDALNPGEAALFGRIERLGALLTGDPAAAGAMTLDGFSPLHLAIFGGSGEAAALLLEHGADVETPSTSSFAAGVRPLGTAAFKRDVELARLLLDHGADPNATAAGGGTPLHTAAQSGDTELVELLLERGADPSLPEGSGQTPADLSREAGHAELAARLER